MRGATAGNPAVDRLGNSILLIGKLRVNKRESCGDGLFFSAYS